MRIKTKDFTVDIPEDTIVIAHSFLHKGNSSKPYLGHQVNMQTRKLIMSNWWIPSSGEIIKHVPYTELDLKQTIEKWIDDACTCRLWVITEHDTLNVWYCNQTG